MGKREQVCSVDGCERPSRRNGLCAMHAQRLRRHGATETLDRQPCTVPGCERLRFGHGLCQMHYLRKTRHGSTDDPRPTTEERFWSHVEKTDGCWLWTGAVGTGGYANFWDGENHVSGHRYAYRMFKGPIPEGLSLDHLCGVRRCVNPDHLEAVTMQENILRSGGPAALNAAKTHCPQGHPYDEENTYFTKDGRACRICLGCRPAAT